MTKFPSSGFMGIKSLLFPSHYYSNPLFIAIIIGTLFLCLNSFNNQILTYIDSKGLNEVLAFFLKLFAFFIPMSLVIFLLLKAMRFVSVLAGFGKRGRWIGPFSKLLDQSMEKALWEELIRRVKIVAGNQGVLNVTYNSDSRDRFRDMIIGKPNILKGKYFLGKYIGERVKKADLKKFNGGDVMFFDPRDV